MGQKPKKLAFFLPKRCMMFADGLEVKFYPAFGINSGLLEVLQIDDDYNLIFQYNTNTDNLQRIYVFLKFSSWPCI